MSEIFNLSPCKIGVDNGNNALGTCNYYLKESLGFYLNSKIKPMNR